MNPFRAWVVCAALLATAPCADARPAFDDEDIKSCIKGVMDVKPSPGPIFAAAYCPCLAREMNKRVTFEDTKNFARLEAASSVSMRVCLAAVEKWMKQKQ